MVFGDPTYVWSNVFVPFVVQWDVPLLRFFFACMVLGMVPTLRTLAISTANARLGATRCRDAWASVAAFRSSTFSVTTSRPGYRCQLNNPPTTLPTTTTPPPPPRPPTPPPPTHTPPCSQVAFILGARFQSEEELPFQSAHTISMVWGLNRGCLQS
jgi:hypothetical protein